VPDHTAVAAALGIPLLHFGKDVFDGEVLLIAGNLLYTKVEQGETGGKVQQAIGPAECIQHPILFGHFAPVAHHALKGSLLLVETVAKCALCLGCGQRGRQQRPDIGVTEFPLPPQSPELPQCSDGAVTRLDLVGGDEKLCPVSRSDRSPDVKRLSSDRQSPLGHGRCVER
jgi:hypothetical protein